VAVNLSLGTANIYDDPITSRLTNEFEALNAAGVFVVASSGNGWYAHQPTQGVAYPAAEATVVAAGNVWTDDFGGIEWSSGAIDYTTAADRIVSHCDRSETQLDILAPGALIMSCAHNWEGDNADFVQMGGTSMAAPAVAAAAVLIREAIEENWAPVDWPTGAAWQDTILQIMQQTGVIVHDGDDEDDNVANLDVDFRRIDLLAALNYTVPEPGAVAVLGLGGVVLLLRRRRLAQRSA